MNTSATGGYLQSAVITDQNDQALYRFLQQLVVGVTGLDGTVVFPRWQGEPPTLPDFGTDWAAVGETRRLNDVNAFEYSHTGSNAGFQIADSLYRNGIIEVLTSFYGPNNQSFAEKFSIGLQLAQNREVMVNSGFGFIECEEAVNVPDFLHNRWVRRTDMRFRVRRAQKYESYGILDITATEIIVKDDTGAINLDIHVNSHNQLLAPVFTMDVRSAGVEDGLDKGNWHP